MPFKLDVIDFFDHTNRSIVQRVPPQGSADIPFGAQLIVQENQEAIFFRDGKAMDAFGPGRHTLTTANIPLLTRILTLPWEKSPFQAQVYFIGKQTFVDQKWGTPQPITLRDADFGMVRLRSFGRFSFRVSDGPLFLNTLVGTQDKYTTDEVSSYLKDVIVSKLTDLLATLGISMLDLPTKFDEVSAAARVQVSSEFAKYGLEMVDFFINAITPPAEVQQAIDARSAMGAIGDLNQFTIYQAASSMSKMAEKQGGSGGIEMGMGAGIGMMMPQMIQQAMQKLQPGGPQASEQPPQAEVQPASAGALPATAAPGLDFAALKPAQTDPRQLVREVADSNGWTIQDSGERWTLKVPVGSLRQQTVAVDFSRQDADGNALISYASTCGPATPGNAMLLLRFNTQMVHGAFAVQRSEAGELVVVQANQLAATADPLEVTRLIAGVAWQADKTEERLIDSDRH